MALLLKEESEGRLTGVKVCRDAPMIHHLFFTDDSFLFVSGTLEECANIKSVLRMYEMALRQAVNLSKSCVSFRPNLMDNAQQWLADYPYGQ